MTADMFPVLTGPVSIIVSVAVLLVTGLFVSVIIGDKIILSGVANEKKIVEKTESEIVEELVTIRQLKRELDEIRDIIKHS
jgi:VIT1/CCC1 family predicted Fe2+/Mn2+ transporter